jgi:LPS-assembly protein
MRTTGRRLSAGAIVVGLLLASSFTTLDASAQVTLTGVPKSGPEPSSFPSPKTLIPSSGSIDSAQPLYLTADRLTYDKRGSLVIARGNIELYYNNYILTADEVSYDQNAKTLTAVGNVELKDPNGTITRGERITLTDDFRDGFIQSLSVVARDDTRIAAQRAIRRDGNVTEFENGKFTPCKNDPGKPPLWCISAARVVHDQAAATITYQDAFFEVLGTPVLYFPYFQHPDPSVKRKSGFLVPEIGSSSTLGFTMELPYYFALAPNYDFTFHPMYTGKQGILWQGDWRHRLSFGDITGQYTVKLAGIFQDDTDEVSERPDLANEWRGSVETRGRFSLSSWWQFGWDVIIESDDTFRRFYKLDSILQTDRVNRAYFTGLSDRNYFGAYLYHFGGLLLDDTSIAESRVHPIIDYNYVFADPVLGGELTFNANALSFSRDLTFNGSNDNSINRVVADAGWRRRFIDPIGQTFTPFANIRGDIYHLQNYVDPTTVNPAVPNSGELVPDETVTRGVASAGLLYSYPFVTAGAGGSHVVEPIAQIIARRKSVEQRRLPDEDARSIVFDDTNLFDLDKNSGLDRIETGTRVNYGVQYTYQSNTGASARVLAGQSYHLSGDNIYADPGFDADGNRLYSPVSGLETDRSDYVLGLYLSPAPIFRAVAQARFDEEEFDLRRSDVFAQFNYGPVLAQVTHAYTAADPALNFTQDQQDVLGLLGLRVTERWSVLGQMRYDISAGDRIQDILQLRYADDCFVLTATYTETHVTNIERDLQPERALMLRFELKYLGDFRYRTDVLDHAYPDNQLPN